MHEWEFVSGKSSEADTDEDISDREKLIAARIRIKELERQLKLQAREENIGQSSNSHKLDGYTQILLNETSEHYKFCASEPECSPNVCNKFDASRASVA